MFAGLLAFLAATPIDDMVVASILGKDIAMPTWVLILLAALFGWLVMPKIVAYVGH